MTIPRATLYNLLALTLRPVAAFCLRHSLRLQDLIECAKIAFVRMAELELARSGRKSNVSRLSLMTGVHRRDVSQGADPLDRAGQERDLITKIIGQWQTDPRFITKSRSPRILSVEGQKSDFVDLVDSVSSDVNPATVLFELERIAAVHKSKSGLQLVSQTHTLKNDPVANFEILSRDLADLTQAVEHNAVLDERPHHFHARTEFDRVRADAIPEIKRWMLQEGFAFHARMREMLSKFDQDINPAATDEPVKLVRVVSSGFSFIEELKEPHYEKKS